MLVVGTHPKGTKYTGKFGYPVPSTTTITELDLTTLDALVLPGGFAPDYMRPSSATTVPSMSLSLRCSDAVPSSAPFATAPGCCAVRAITAVSLSSLGGAQQHSVQSRTTSSTLVHSGLMIHQSSSTKTLSLHKRRQI